MSYKPERDSRSQSFRNTLVYSATRGRIARLLAAVRFKIIGRQRCRNAHDVRAPFHQLQPSPHAILHLARSSRLAGTLGVVPPTR